MIAPWRPGPVAGAGSRAGEPNRMAGGEPSRRADGVSADGVHYPERILLKCPVPVNDIPAYCC